MALTIEQLRPELEKRWNDYALNTDASIYHDTRWIHLIKKVFGHDSYHIIALEDGAVRGILPVVRLKSVLFGDYMVSMPYFNYGGAIADNKSIESAMMEKSIELASMFGLTHIEFRDTDARSGEWAVRTDKVNMILNLPESVDALGEKIGSKIRSQIRRPVKEGVYCVSGAHELIDEFYKVFSINMRDLGTPVYSKRFFAEILRNFPQESRIVILKLKEKPISAAFLMAYKNRMEIPWASTIREYNKISPNMLLYWEVLKTAIESGYTQFDFGRSTMGSGTYKFKKQWGAEPKHLFWHYWISNGREIPKMNPENKKYKIAIKAWQHLPVAASNLLGPCIVKNLP